MVPRDLDAAGHVLLRLARLSLEAGADCEHVWQRVAAIAAALTSGGLDLHAAPARVDAAARDGPDYPA